MGCRVGGSLLPHVLPPLSHPRPGDRIMLVDDSNEDWWKVTWQGGERRVGGGRYITSPHPQRTQPQRPPLLPPPALARPRPTVRSYSHCAPPRPSLVPPSTLCPFQPRSHPTRGSNTEKPNLEDDSIGSEWALGLEKAVGVRGWHECSLPASSPGQDRRPGWLLPSQFCAAGEARGERLALLPTLLREQGTGLHEPQGEPGEGLGPAWLERSAWERGGKGVGEGPGGGCLQPGSRREGRLEAVGLGSSLVA